MYNHIQAVCTIIVCLISATATSSIYLQADVGTHPWKNTEELKPANPSLLEEERSKQETHIYFLRHAQNTANLWHAEHKDVAKHKLPPVQDMYKDGALTDKGLKQAVQAQRILIELLPREIDPSIIQLASSPAARAHDTLVIASSPLWTKWRREHVNFMVDTVPAAYELDATISSQRKRGVKNDDPVRWEDSTLAQDFSKNPSVSDIFQDNDGFQEGAKAMFYETESDRNDTKHMTSKPIQVQTFYKRIPTDFAMEQCESPAVEKFADYLNSAADAGKKHIVVSAHGSIIMCLFSRYGTNETVPILKMPNNVQLDGEAFNMTHFGHFPNAGVLHVQMKRKPNRPIRLEAQNLHTVELESI